MGFNSAFKGLSKYDIRFVDNNYVSGFAKYRNIWALSKTFQIWHLLPRKEPRYIPSPISLEKIYVTE